MSDPAVETLTFLPFRSAVVFGPFGGKVSQVRGYAPDRVQNNQSAPAGVAGRLMPGRQLKTVGGSKGDLFAH